MTTDSTGKYECPKTVWGCSNRKDSDPEVCKRCLKIPDEPKPVIQFPTEPPSCWTCSNGDKCTKVKQVLFDGIMITTPHDVRQLFWNLASDCRKYILRNES